MHIYRTDFNKVISKGQVIFETTKDTLIIKDTLFQNTRFYQKEEPISSYVQIPDAFRLPLQIDMTINMDSPALYILLGKGHLNFGSFMDNRCIGDIAEPDTKTHSFYNQISINKDVNISILYGMDFMQVIVDGETRYFSKKEKYMKSPLFVQANADGFPLKIACDKHTRLCVKKLRITEYDNDDFSPLLYDNIINSQILSIDKKAKSDFEECLSILSPELANEIRITDDYLRKTKALSIKRKIEGDSKACKINYVSSHGFSYAIRISENAMNHFFWWYMVSNYKFEGKYMGRKNDLTAETLVRMSQIAPGLTERLFSYYDDCVSCSTNCKVKTIYELNGKKKVACHGKMLMNMNISTLSDARSMIEAICDIITSH